ncbi:MAG: hypothetical protein LBE91_21380 [Tannerella sp.]|jgi:hypothetical protein|nr:hypothetical protein [Tannerella sp.]
MICKNGNNRIANPLKRKRDMMYKFGYKYFLFILLIMFFFVFSINHFSYVPFEPTGFDGEKYIKLKFDNKEYEKLAIVLDCYHVNFKKKQGVILVHRDLIKDKELLLNYTNKVTDENWKCPAGADLQAIRRTGYKPARAEYTLNHI